MAYEADEDSFDDVDFEDLPHEALDELETKAIQYTQTQPVPRALAPPSSDYGDDFDDEDLDDNVVIDESRSTPAPKPSIQPHRPSQHLHNLPQRASQTVDQAPRIQTSHTYRSQAPPIPRFNNSQRSGTKTPNEFESNNAGQGQDVVNLRRQIEELIKERDALKEDLNTKTGEIAIVRNKHEKKRKEHERELSSLRKLNADALAKQTRELEAARVAERAAATERDFLRQDTAEAVRSRRVNHAREEQKKDTNELLTPRKKKIFAPRDGFDDAEIEFLSPTKNSPSKLRKTSSPNKASKRKRKDEESPAGPLEVVNDEEPKSTHLPNIFDEALLKKLTVQDDRFDFLGMILDHKFDSEHQRTIEELGKYKLPGSAESLQSMILGKIPSLGHHSAADFPVKFCGHITSLLGLCVKQTYFSPVYLFVDILTLALELKTTLLAPHLIDDLVPLTQAIIEPIIVERFTNRPSPEPCDVSTGSTAGLSLLHILALGCMSEEQHIVRFWRYMRYDNTMMIFTPNQLMADTEIMLKLLSTSVFENSFGVPTDEGYSHTVFTNILEKLTLFFVNIPKQPRSEVPYEANVVSELRLQVLQLMTSMTRSPYASKFLATHRNAIGRLVLLVSDELDKLYDYKPERQSSARIITLATRLLYHLVMKHEEVINMQKKLSIVPGGHQKYLLSLARLNFSEDDLVLEVGIEPDVATCALELLEMVVTPEEGDAIHAAFSSQ